MFKIIKNFNWIILSSFLCIFMGIVTFLTFINEGFIPLTDQNLQILLIIDVALLIIFFCITVTPFLINLFLHEGDFTSRQCVFELDLNKKIILIKHYLINN